MNEPTIDQTIESIAQEVVDTMPPYCHPAIFLLRDTGGVTRQPDIENRVSVINQERDTERRRIAVEQHALATVRSQETLFEALVAQSVTEIEIRFAAHCTDGSFEDGDESLEILNMKRHKTIVGDDHGILTVTDEATFLKAIGEILRRVLDDEWSGWDNLNDSVAGSFIVDVANRTIHLAQGSLSYEFEHMPFGH